MKNIEKYLILVISLIAIGAIATAVYFATNDQNSDDNETFIKDDLNFNYNDYHYVGIDSDYKIINSYDGLDNLLNSLTENNVYNSEVIKNIRDKYLNYNFEKNQLVLLNTSGSGCDYDNIKTYLNFNVEKDTLIVKYVTEDSSITCQRYMKQITIIEITSTSINSVLLYR